MTLGNLIVVLLGGVPTSIGGYDSPWHIPFYELAAICLMLKFAILTSQRNVRNQLLAVVYGGHNEG